MSKSNFVSGFVSIIGKPNVGKSTLLNTLVGKKVAITTPTPHTTRENISGIYNDSESQIIFIDTPGIHKAKNAYDVQMNEGAMEATFDIDALIFMVSAVERIDDNITDLIKAISEKHVPKYLVINKIDLLKSKTDIDKIILEYLEYLKFDAVFPISAKNNTNISYLVKEIKSILPIGPMYYPIEMTTDHDLRFQIQEIIREKAFYFTKEEIPHSLIVVVDSFKEENDLDEIFATIYVERDSQKKIVIGDSGAMIKHIKDLAKKEIKRLVNKKVDLNLWVKVKKDWTNDTKLINQLSNYRDNY